MTGLEARLGARGPALVEFRPPWPVRAAEGPLVRYTLRCRACGIIVRAGGVLERETLCCDCEEESWA